MNLILSDSKKLVAEKDLKDDAFELWRECKSELKYKAATAVFWSRHDIKIGVEYLNIEFVDEESGEVLDINVLGKLHRAMIRFKLYPLVILNALK